MAPINGDIMPERRRITAIKTSISSIVNGKYVKGEGINSSYIVSPLGMKLSRVRILSFITDKFISPDKKFGSITLDDGTETIRAKVFRAVSMIEGLNKGDMIDVIGKVREYNNEIYVSPEIIWKVDNPNFLILRKLELLKEVKELKGIKSLVLEMQKQTSDIEELKSVMKKKYGIDPEIVEAVLIAQEEPQTKSIDMTAERERIIKLIKDLDEENGCEYSKLIEASGLPEEVLEAIVNELLSDGTCFEPKPGYIKLL